MQGKGVKTDWRELGHFIVFGICAIFVLSIIAYACNIKEPKRNPPKYKQGDVVWLNPDSTRAVISHVWISDLQYKVDYYDNQHEPQDMIVPEFGIYSIVNN